MKANLKLFAVAALASVIAVGATGCVTMKPQEDLNNEMNDLLEGVDFNAGKDYKGSLQIMVMRSQSEQDNIKAFVDSFKASYPNIEVTFDTSANYQEDLILQHAYATSQDKYQEMPDVFWTSNEDVPGYVAKGMLMPISYFVEADKNFSTDGLVSTMVKDASFNGELYFMPRDYNQVTMYYNSEIFEKANVPDPSSYKDENGQVREMTKQEFDTMVRSLADWMAATKETTAQGKKYSDGRAVELQAFWNSLNYAVFKGNGAPIVGEDGYVDLESDAAIKTIYYFWDLVYNDIAAGMTEVSMSAHNLFIQGLSALCLDTRASLSDIVQSSGKIPGVCETLGAAPFPNLSDGDYYVGAGCSGYGMYRNTDDPTAAWLFLKHIVSEPGQNAFCQTGNGCPVLKSMFEDSTSTWKNIKQENPTLYAKLPADFNHDAFVYQYATCGIPLEFKDKLPIGAQETVLEQLRIAVITPVSSVTPTNPSNYTQEEIFTHIRKVLSDLGSVAKMNQAIDRAKAQEEADKQEQEQDKTNENTQEGA